MDLVANCSIFSAVPSLSSSRLKSSKKSSSAETEVVAVVGCSWLTFLVANAPIFTSFAAPPPLDSSASLKREMQIIYSGGNARYSIFKFWFHEIWLLLKIWVQTSTISWYFSSAIKKYIITKISGNCITSGVIFDPKISKIFRSDCELLVLSFWRHVSYLLCDWFVLDLDRNFWTPKLSLDE